MDLQISALLAQDGIVNGAIYALLALALVLVFSVTRVIFVPQGELVALGALSLATLQAGHTPPTLWLLLALAAGVLLVELVRQQRGLAVDWPVTLVWTLLLPGAAALMSLALKPTGLAGQVGTTLLLITPMGPLLYRLAFRPLADATVLTLLIAAVALHGVLVGLGLYLFGPEGFSTSRFSEARFDVGNGIQITGQSLVVVGVAAALSALLFVFFERSIVGKALRATAVNRVGARLMGIPTSLAGDLSFALAALIGAVSGMLVAPITTIQYDTGFLMGLKGFVAAIIGGLASYPLAMAGAVLVGLLESFSAFWASALKEVIVFTLIIPVLLWRSLRSRHVEEDE
ncbi:branched-chain amino acid ABC transporter permease [Ideonella sp. BN130291]|uniref:branched-chain amino acid ABC transporter permease n=1 Tax=Ideonella sp. BN130291 TaxID=3112940 RepID=UPI002E26E11B|nr:branched-chain amino acid ABC transporter permease [Ideonella sp. BN130291]